MRFIKKIPKGNPRKMRSSDLALAFMCAIGLTLVPVCQTQNTPQDYLNVHNAARARVGVGNMIWDRTVATFAQNYANRQIGNCELVQSGGPYGGNVFWGYGGEYTGADAVNAWVSKKPYYNYASNTCATGKVCGHYTQVVWRNSTSLGCARVKCDSRTIFIICSYDPPGNLVGERPY